MSSIFGVFSKRGKLSPETFTEVILSHKIKGPDGWGVVADGRVEKHLEYEELEGLECEYLLGHTLLKIDEEEPQPIAFDETFLSFDGWLSTPFEKMDDIAGIEGEFSLWYFENNVLKLLRDSVGTKPLFYGVNKNFFAFSSLKEALHKIGMKNIASLKPGNLLNYKKGEIRIESCNPLPTPSFSLQVTPSFKQKLKEALLHSVEKRLMGVRKAGVLFSSGVDSTLIAHIARKFDLNLSLYCVGTESSEDIRYSKRFARELGLDVKQIILTEEEIIQYYEKLRGFLQDKGLMRIELAIPIFTCSEHAKEDGVRVLLSGQGAEELFVGYERYAQCWRKGGDLRRMLFEELQALHSKDLEWNEYVASLNHCQLRYPFLDKEVIQVATSIKPELNFEGGKKAVLREVAKEMGLPHEIAERPKRAVQYGSGIHKTILKALRNGKIK